jgi:FixJ family two-component response regulator
MTLISIIDDDEGFRDALTNLIRSLGFRVEAFQSAEEFLTSANVRNTSCLIADVHMAGMTGLELHSRLVESGYAISTILLTAYPDDRVRALALADGVICFMSKPFDEGTLIGCLRSALDRTKPGEGGS